MPLAEKAMANTFHYKAADSSDWAVVEDNVFVFLCPVCRRTNCLNCQAIHDNFANCKEFQDRVHDAAETNDAATRTKEIIDVIYLYRICIEKLGPNNDVILNRRLVFDFLLSTRPSFVAPLT